MRIFVDVGAHYGESARVALAHDFDRVYSLEPSALAFQELSKIKDKRLFAQKLGLSKKSGTAILYGAGLLGGSVYADKRQKTAKLSIETIDLVCASDWFKAIPDLGETFVKMNCEGSEADILDDLLASGQIDRIDRLFVHFDINKVAGQGGREEDLKLRLTKRGVRWTDAHGLSVRAWLAYCRVPERQTFRFDPYGFVVSALRSILPQRAFWWLGHRFGRISRLRAPAHPMFRDGPAKD